MKFYLFAGDTYYPEGGAEDFMKSFDCIEDAKNYFNPESYDWAHISNENMDILSKYEKNPRLSSVWSEEKL